MVANILSREKLKIQYNKKTIVIYVIVSVFVVIFTIWTLFWGGIDISLASYFASKRAINKMRGPGQPTLLGILLVFNI